MISMIGDWYMTYVHANIDTVAWVSVIISASYMFYGIVKLLYIYAKAEPFGNLENSSHIIAYMTDDYFDGRHIGGYMMDGAVIMGVGVILAFAWPVIAIFLLIFVPLHIMRLRNIKKKEFIGKLNGQSTS